MRESDSFAFGPGRKKEEKAARLPRVRSGRVRSVHPGLRRVASALVPAPLLLLITMTAFALAWSSLTLVLAYRNLPRIFVPIRSALVSLLSHPRKPVLTGSISMNAVLQIEKRHVRSILRTGGSRTSRRTTAAIAVTLSFLLFGGMIPLNAAPNDITTVAGRPDAGDRGAATAGLVHVPRDVAVGSGGEVYVADTYNHRIRRISTTGVITTVAGNGTSGFSGDGGPATSARLRFPQGVWVDPAGNLYIADSGNHRVRLVTPGGTMSTVAGTGTAGFSGDGGPATAAQLNDPKDITTDTAGNLYIADNENHRIRRVGGAGIITTHAGNGIEGYAGDGGPATSASLNDPTGLAFNATSDQLYIADTDNHRIRRVNPSGIIENYVGTGTAGATNHAQLGRSTVNRPQRLSYANGGLYFADAGNHMVRFITNSVVYVAGDATAGFSGDGGSATTAQLDTPTGVAWFGGSVYIADSDNHRIRTLRDDAGTISTFAGRSHFGGDGGAAIDAHLNRPSGVSTDGAGNLYIADWENHRVRRVSGGTITTVAGTGVQGTAGDGGLATSAQLNDPLDVAVDASGNLYIADTGSNKIRKVDAAGTITTYAGTGTFGFAGDGGPATAAQLRNPYGVEVDGAGNVYIADTLNHRIRRVAPDGTITTVAGSGSGMFCGDGGAATSACLEDPMDVAVNAAGNLYIADYSNHRIRSVISGTIRTVAGNGSSSYSGDGGPATSAALNLPGGVEIDPSGSILIADSSNARIRRVSPGGTITTVGGTGAFGFAGDGGPAVAGELSFPLHIALDPSGNLYVADLYNNRIRMIESLGTLPGPTMTGTTPASPANDNTPLVRGTATDGTTVRLYTDPGCLGAIASTGSAAAFADPGLEATVVDDSTTSFYATSTDAAGNVSACSSTPVIYLEDSTAPGAPTITIAPASPGSDASPSWSFSTDAGATAQCELSSGGTVLSAYASCTSPKVYDLSMRPDGAYTFSVRASDAAGNTGAAAIHTYVLDSTVPTAVEITSSPATPSNDRNPTWGFSVEAGSTAECEFSYGGTVIQPFASCASPTSLDLTGDPDGAYTLRVQARDAAGNPSAPVSSLYTLDTTVPGAPAITSQPPSPGNSTAPSWSFTVEAGATAECELRRGGTVVSAWQPCSSPESYNLSGEPDGLYDFGVRAVDAAGNTGTAISSSYRLDTTGPDVTIGSSPSTPDNNTNPSWSFSSEAGSTLECQLQRGQTILSAWSVCSSPAAYDLNGQLDGAYTFSARATDPVGNTGDPRGSVYVYDTTAPVVEITSAPAPVSSERNPQWSFTTEAGASLECQLSDSAGVLQAFAPCTSPQAYDLSARPDDTYTFSVRATDVAGNLGPASSSGYYLDTSGPASSITSSPATPGNGRSPAWGFSAEAGSTTECELFGPSDVVSPYTPCLSPQGYDLTGLPDGPYTFNVRATDGAGNLGAPAANTYTLDTAAPGAPAITSAPATPGNLRSVSWSFTADAGTTTQCELSRGGAAVSGWATCSSPKTYSLEGQPDGSYTFRVRAVDGAGNIGPAAASTYVFDTTGPTMSIEAPRSPGNDRTPSWTLSTEGGAAIECRLAGGGVTPPFTPCDSSTTFDLSGRADGPYTLSARATDPAGNIGAVESSTYLLDTSGPLVEIVSEPANPGSGTSPSWSFTTEPDAQAQCELLRDGAVIEPFASCSSPATFDLSGEPNGEYRVRLRATDVAGNTGPVIEGSYRLDRSPPAVPVITGSPSSPSSARSVTWTFTLESGAAAECELAQGATVLHAFAACSGSKTFDLTGKPDGNYAFRVRALDELGSASAAASATYALDTTGPTVTITSGPATPGDGKNPTWGFTVELGATTECSVSRSGTVIYPAAPCSSPEAFDLGGEPDGTYTFRVRATDALGNQGPAASSNYVLSTVQDEPQPENPSAAPAPEEAGPPLAEPAEEPTEEAAPPIERDGNDRREKQPRDGQGDLEEEDVIPPAETLTDQSSGQGEGVLGEVFENVSTVVTGLLEEPAFPLILICLVVSFLVLQNRMDRRDPKLALAPVYPDPHLYFDPQDRPQKGR